MEAHFCRETKNEKRALIKMKTLMVSQTPNYYILLYSFLSIHQYTKAYSLHVKTYLAINLESDPVYKSRKVKKM